MKVRLEYKVWLRAKKELGLIRLDDKVNYKGDVKHSYILRFDPAKPYPRFHFETFKARGFWERNIDLHIDWKQHTQSDGFHPLITDMFDKIQSS